jgi:hypothetical protein
VLGVPFDMISRAKRQGGGAHDRVMVGGVLGLYADHAGLAWLCL